MKKLTAIFSSALLGTSLFFGQGCKAPSGAGTQSSPLTAGEQALSKGIFGDEIYPEVVTKHLDPTSKYPILAETPSKWHIHFYGKSQHSLDYSKEDNAANYGTFIHEMAHIWQGQNYQQAVFKHKRNKVYQYTLSEQKKFKDFGIEQQAAIIEDYTRRFLHSRHSLYWASPSPETDELLKKTVEERFPQARISRMKFESWKKEMEAKDEFYFLMNDRGFPVDESIDKSQSHSSAPKLKL